MQQRARFHSSGRAPSRSWTAAVNDHGQDQAHSVDGDVPFAAVHRACSTIASQLYNAKEPMTLFELQAWLGHRELSSTHHYAKINTNTLPRAYRDAGTSNTTSAPWKSSSTATPSAPVPLPSGEP